ncbi:MAG: KamA family radical SAM protein [Polyangiales bacterium]
MGLPVPPDPKPRALEDAGWDDWRWQARHAVTDLEGLERVLALTEGERAGARRALDEGLPISITPYYLSLADRHDPGCPIRLQCVPRAEEAIEVPGDLRDPLGEEAHEVAPELVQRYPDRVLLLATDRCAVYCRFCTRSRMVGDGGGARSLDHLERAFRYIEEHPEISDVIVSGGDPLVMSTSRIVSLLERLARIDHVMYVRLATRAPVTLPQRVTDELCSALRASYPSLWIMTHFNHPKELTDASRAACARLVDHGLPVMNQTVLLRGVNDDAKTLETLFRGLVRTRVRPYYLLQMDPVRGSGHLRTPLSRGVELMEQLQGRLSGIALPKLICDTPGGRGKVPLSPEVVVGRKPGVTTLRTFRGEHVDYVDPPEFDGSPP